MVRENLERIFYIGNSLTIVLCCYHKHTIQHIIIIQTTIYTFKLLVILYANSLSADDSYHENQMILRLMHYNDLSKLTVTITRELINK